MADFAITVVANLDPQMGPVAEGGTGGPAEPEDFAHVRNWVHGMLSANVAAGLPAGWDIEVVAFSETHAQRELADPRKPVLLVVRADRFAQVEMRECGACGGVLRRDAPDAIWYHVPACTDPTPVGEPRAMQTQRDTEG